MTELINPFIAGAPVVEAKMFFGRDDVFDWIQNSLMGRYADQILVIHGQRRVGKTSVLKQLGNRLPSKYIPVFFDLQGRTHTTLDRFLWWLAREIVRVVKQERNIELTLPEKELFNADQDYFETRFLTETRILLGDYSLLLTFDEFDNLEESEIKDDLAKPLINYLRRLQGMEGLNFIFSIGSSGRKLENMQAEYTEFFKTALYKKISFLTREQSQDLIEKPLAGYLEIEPEAVSGIYEITSGHPYFTQLICHELFSLCQRTGQLLIKTSDVDLIIDDVVERGTVNLKFVWDEANDIEKWILTALTQKSQDHSVGGIGEFLKNQKVRYSDSDLLSGILHLQEKDIVTKDFRFVIYLLKIWLQKNRPIEQVKEELTEVNPIANRFIEIGQEFQSTKQYDRALQNYREALEVSPNNTRAQVRIASAYYEQSAYGKAIIEFEKALLLDDEDIEARSGICSAYLNLGNNYRTEGRLQEAANCFRKILEINREHTEACQRVAEILILKAEKALADGKDDEALSGYAEALKLTPEDINLEEKFNKVKSEKKTKVISSLLARAERELSVKSWDSALNLLKSAAELDPDKTDIQYKIEKVLEEIRQTKLRSLLLRADKAEKAERWDLTVQILEEYLGFDPENKSILERKSRVQNRGLNDRKEQLKKSAHAMFRTEKFDAATQMWNDYFSLAPEERELIKTELARINEAKNLAEKYSEAMNYYSQKNFSKTIDLLKQVITINTHYKDSARILSEAIELRRKNLKIWHRKWFQISFGGIVLFSLVLLIVFILRNNMITKPTSVPTQTHQPITQMANTAVSTPTETPVPVNVYWSRVSQGQEFARDIVKAFAIDPADSDLMYAGMQYAGIYRSVDGGDSWQPIQEGVQDTDIVSILIDPINTEILYSSFGFGKVYKSTDHGDSWKKVWDNNEYGLCKLYLDPQNHEHLFFVSKLIYESTDSGVSWSAIQGSEFTSIDDFAVDPVDSNILYIVMNNSQGGLFRSEDGGDTWNNIELDVEKIQAISIGSGDGSVLFVRSGDFLYRSMNRGQTWQNLPLSGKLNIIRSENIYSPPMIVPSISNASITNQLMISTDLGDSWQDTGDVNSNDVDFFLFIGTSNLNMIYGGSNGLLMSLDSGKTWEVRNNGLGNVGLDLKVDPFHPDTFYMIENAFYDIGPERLFRSSDKGITWSMVEKNGKGLAFDSDGLSIYRHGDGTLRSEDLGETWVSIPYSDWDWTEQFSANPYLPKNLFVRVWWDDPKLISSNYFFASYDGGNTWAYVPGGSDRNGTLYWSSDPNVVYVDWARSEDGGKNWIQCRPNKPWSASRTSSLFAIDPEDPMHLYVATRDNGIMESMDGCDSWVSVSAEWGITNTTGVVIDPESPDKLYAGTLNGVFISYDAGKQWQAANDGLLGALTIYSITFDNISGGVFVTTPYGVFEMEERKL